MCQRPGSLPALTCTRPSGLSGQLEWPPATMPAVPIVKPAEPLLDQPHRRGLDDGVAAAAEHRRAGGQAPGLAEVVAERPGLLDRLDHVGQQRRVDVDLAEQLGRPGAVLDVEQAGA